MISKWASMGVKWTSLYWQHQCWLLRHCFSMNQPLTFENCKSHAPLVTDREAGWIPSVFQIWDTGQESFELPCLPLWKWNIALLDMQLVLERPLFPVSWLWEEEQEVALSALSHSHSMPLRFWSWGYNSSMNCTRTIDHPYWIKSNRTKKITSFAANIWGGYDCFDNVKCWVQSLLGWSVCAPLCKPRVPGLGTSAAALPCELKSDLDEWKTCFYNLASYVWNASASCFSFLVTLPKAIPSSLAGILPNNCTL